MTYAAQRSDSPDETLSYSSGSTIDTGGTMYIVRGRRVIRWWRKWVQMRKTNRRAVTRVALHRRNFPGTVIDNVLDFLG